MPLLRKEFIAVHHLNPVKIFVSGPPTVGKTRLSKIISQELNIPLIDVKSIVSWSSQFPEDDPLTEEITSKLNELRENMANELNELNQKTNPDAEPVDPVTVTV